MQDIFGLPRGQPVDLILPERDRGFIKKANLEEVGALRVSEGLGRRLPAQLCATRRLSHTKFFESRFAEVNFPTNPSTYFNMKKKNYRFV